jgi:hypothetical protein
MNVYRPRRNSMHDEHNTESKQRQADHMMELAVWPDEESKEISLEHLGGRKVGHQTPSGKPVDLSAAYGETGKLVCKAPEPERE